MTGGDGDSAEPSQGISWNVGIEEAEVPSLGKVYYVGQ